MLTNEYKAAGDARIGARRALGERSALMGLLRSCFARTQTWLQAGKYLNALVSDLPSRNGWTIGGQAGDQTPTRAQRLLNRASWDEAALVADVMQAAVHQHHVVAVSCQIHGLQRLIAHGDADTLGPGEPFDLLAGYRAHLDRIDLIAELSEPDSIRSLACPQVQCDAGAAPCRHSQQGGMKLVVNHRVDAVPVLTASPVPLVSSILPVKEGPDLRHVAERHGRCDRACRSASQRLQSPLDPVQPPGALHQGIDTKETEEPQDDLPLGDLGTENRRLQGHEHRGGDQDHGHDRVKPQHAAQPFSHPPITKPG